MPKKHSVLNGEKEAINIYNTAIQGPCQTKIRCSGPQNKNKYSHPVMHIVISKYRLLFTPQSTLSLH